MKIKEKLMKTKNKACEFAERHWETIIYGGCALFICGVTFYFKGYSSGMRAGRTEWDFGNDKGEWAVIMEENGDFRTALPISALKEVMDKHKTIPWDNSMWRSL